jgi:hypothetical protein
MKETEKLLRAQVRRLLRHVEATDHRRCDTDRQSDKLAEELRRRKVG